MNKYVKPAFMLTSLSSNALTGGNCSIKKDDYNLIKDILGEDSFLATENCVDEMDGVLDGYCKFTAGQLGATQIFFS